MAGPVGVGVFKEYEGDFLIYETGQRGRLPRQVAGWFTDEPPAPTSGYGGWRSDRRPRKSALTVWDGRAPFELPITMLLYHHGNSVMGSIKTLGNLATGHQASPPTVRVTGALMVPDTPSDEWVIQDIGWGKAIRRKDAAITSQVVTVTLLEHVDDKLLAASTLRDRQGRKTVIRHYKVKKGDTLRSIAARQLGDAKRWADIAGLNGLRSDGQLKKRIGKLITLP